MKQLHPRAVWLFFFSFLWKWIGIFILLGYLVFSAKEIFTIFTSVGEKAKEPDFIDFIISVLPWFFLVLILYLFLCYIWARLSYAYYRYELTDSAFKKEHGVIYKKYVTIPYDRIQNVDIYRGILARFLGLSDLQIQTAGGITAGSYGAFAEGRLPGTSKEEAEILREQLVQNVRQSKNQGL